MALHGASTALLLPVLVLVLVLVLVPVPVSAGSAVIVPAPTNVSVSCRNLDTTVTWDYGERTPGTRFRVEITSSEGHHENETTEQRYDLSHFIWASQWRYMGFHFVSVTALQGDRKSAPARSQTFTFNGNKVADLHCALDFPPVDVASGDSGTAVTFRNPFHFYARLKRAAKLEVSFFEFNVSTDHGEFNSVCRLTQVICRYDVPPPGAADACVTLKGWLDYGNRAEYVAFRETGRVCPGAAPGVHAAVLAALLCVFALAVALVTVGICVTRAWTMKSPGLPRALDFERMDGGGGEERARYGAVPCVEFGQRYDSLSVGSAGGVSSRSCSAASDLDHQRGCRRTGLCGTDEDSVRSQCGLTDEEEEEEQEEPGPQYDRPHVLQVDFGDGDLVEGYTNR